MSDFRKVTDQVSVSPQIILEDFSEITTLGYRSIICNRPNGEEMGQPQCEDLESAAKSAGLAWANIHIGASGMTMDHVESMAQALTDLEKPILAFCRTGTRSCNIWALGEALSGDMTADEMIAAGAAAGYDLNMLRPTLENLRATRK